MSETRAPNLFPEAARLLVDALLREELRLHDRAMRLERAVTRAATNAEVFEQLRQLSELSRDFADLAAATLARTEERVAVLRNAGRLTRKED